MKDNCPCVLTERSCKNQKQKCQLVIKKDRSMRTHVDCHALHEQIRQTKYALPQTDDFMDKVTCDHVHMLHHLPRLLLLLGGASLRRTGYFSMRDRPPPRSVIMSSMLTQDSLSELPVSLSSSSSSLEPVSSYSKSPSPAQKHTVVATYLWLPD